MFILFLELILKIWTFGAVDLVASYNSNDFSYVLNVLTTTDLIVILCSYFIWLIGYKTIRKVLKK